MFGKKRKVNPEEVNEKKAAALNKAAASERSRWYKDRYYFAVVQRNVLLLLLLISLGCIFFGLIYINLISQKKTIEPFVVEIDERTGIPTVVNQVSKKQYTANNIIVEYFLYRYVLARESYDYKDFNYKYYTVVRLLSSPKVFRSFYTSVNIRNDNSPYNLYGRNVRLVPKIRSILNISGGKQIRIIVQHIKNNAIIKEEKKIIFLRYRFIELNLSLDARLVNPLGFQVTEYKIEDEL